MPTMGNRDERHVFDVQAYGIAKFYHEPNLLVPLSTPFSRLQMPQL